MGPRSNHQECSKVEQLMQTALNSGRNQQDYNQIVQHANDCVNCRDKFNEKTFRDFLCSKVSKKCGSPSLLYHIRNKIQGSRFSV